MRISEPGRVVSEAWAALKGVGMGTKRRDDAWALPSQRHQGLRRDRRTRTSLRPLMVHLIAVGCGMRTGLGL